MARDPLPTALVAHDIYRSHDTGPYHPESPSRYAAVAATLESSGLDGVVRLERRRAEDDELLLCHQAEYLELVRREVSDGCAELSTGDTNVCGKSLDVAAEAAGGVLAAVDAVLGEQARNVFCAVRPPGHHARPNQGMGFCLFNNIAIGARYAQRRHGAERVFILDWDVHHGNGTQDIFYADPTVLFCSTHQSPWYPGTGKEWETGEGAGRGATMNFPLPAGSGREQILPAVREKALPAARDFQPDLVMISAGFDSRVGDPLGQFTLTEDDFEELTELMMELADVYCEGRIVSVLEGGYNLTGLASAARRHFDVLRRR